MIAMALSCSPKLLIADEPTTALDVTIQAQILDLIKTLKQDTNAAIVLITHDLGVVSEICDTVTVMYAGCVVERGSVDDIFYRPAHPYTRGLLACLPRLDDDSKRELDAIEGAPVDLLEMPEGCPFAPRCRHAMKICLKKIPPEFEVSETQSAVCWLCACNVGADSISAREDADSISARSTGAQP
jgi:oligopeptide transport system ATP-binding protein